MNQENVITEITKITEGLIKNDLCFGFNAWKCRQVIFHLEHLRPWPPTEDVEKALLDFKEILIKRNALNYFNICALCEQVKDRSYSNYITVDYDTESVQYKVIKLVLKEHLQNDKYLNASPYKIYKLYKLLRESITSQSNEGLNEIDDYVEHYLDCCVKQNLCIWDLSVHEEYVI